MQSTLELLQKNPVIAAVRSRAEIEAALQGPAPVLFLMGGSISTIAEITAHSRQVDKQIYVHIELIKGLGRDREGIEFIAENVRPQGIVTTKPQLLKVAAKYGLTTVFQVFMIDSQAFESGLKSIQTTRPDAVEMMPGLMPRVAAQIKSYLDIPLLAAGLIKQSHEVEMMLGAGCSGVAVSEQSLWAYPSH